MGYINKKMLVIEVNVEFIMMNGFVFKYLHIEQACNYNHVDNLYLQ